MDANSEAYLLAGYAWAPLRDPELHRRTEVRSPQNTYKEWNKG